MNTFGFAETKGVFRVNCLRFVKLCELGQLYPQQSRAYRLCGGHAYLCCLHPRCDGINARGDSQ